MAPRDFKELQCWQLADRLRTEVVAICARPEVAAHGRFCDSLLETAASVCRNISEGFTRFSSGEIVKFFGYALGSLAEIRDHLVECETRKFIDAEKHKQLNDLAEHTKATALNFIKTHKERLAAQRARRARSRNMRT